MNQAPVTVTYSLEEVLGQINQKLDRLDEKIDRQSEATNRKIDNLQEETNRKIDNLQKEITEFRLETKISFETVKGELKVLDEKGNGLSKRLENQEFVNRGILVALVIAILGSAAKLLGWVGNP